MKQGRMSGADFAVKWKTTGRIYGVDSHHIKLYLRLLIP